ncbi:protein-L-isoaspartate carboxylmethyltransferase [Microbacterium sp. PA5]|uniref:protein-L-isoaspartate carboxylmethyltransferase n=1 Tax=Microbacterium sp. PA5 TaxID=3416654 RepID=UPI003CFA08DD
MPYRDRAHVERWLSDFWDTHSVFAGELSVVDNDFVPHTDSGLVVAHLDNSPGIAYISVQMIDDRPRWMVTFEPRPEAIDLDAAGVRGLADEVGALGVLCAYLQTRTDEAIAQLR